MQGYGKKSSVNRERKVCERVTRQRTHVGLLDQPIQDVAQPLPVHPTLFPSFLAHLKPPFLLIRLGPLFELDALHERPISVDREVPVLVLGRDPPGPS